jgi:hypothetical protein
VELLIEISVVQKALVERISWLGFNFFQPLTVAEYMEHRKTHGQQFSSFEFRVLPRMSWVKWK